MGNCHMANAKSRLNRMISHAILIMALIGTVLVLIEISQNITQELNSEASAQISSELPTAVHTPTPLLRPTITLPPIEDA